MPLSEYDYFEHSGFSGVSVDYVKRVSLFLSHGWEGAPV